MLALGSAFTGFAAPAAPAPQRRRRARAAAEARARSLSVAGQEDTKVAYWHEDDSFAYGLPGIPPMNAGTRGTSSRARPRPRSTSTARPSWRTAAWRCSRRSALVQEFYHPLFSPEITNVAINQIPELPPVFWFALTLGISAAEITRIQLGFAKPCEANVKGKKGARDEVRALKEGYYPGDLRFDPLNIDRRRPTPSARCRSASFSHGRLAMFAAAGHRAETVDQEPWGFYWGLNDAWNAFDAPRRVLISLCMCCVGVSCRGVRRNLTDPSLSAELKTLRGRAAYARRRAGRKAPRASPPPLAAARRVLSGRQLGPHRHRLDRSAPRTQSWRT